MLKLKKLKTRCQNCSEETARTSYKYCSNSCQIKYQRDILLTKWKAGEINGISSIGTVASFVKIYLRQKYKNKCVLCGWLEINQKTGKVPLVADHIDGNWRNNTESNLRLICPNCDSLTPTYSALNRGNGRIGRAVSKRTIEGYLLAKNNKPK